MDPTERSNVTHAMPRHDDEELRRRFDDVMGEPLEPLQAPDLPVDLRAYLLDPPPTPEESERFERRRVLVRRGSLGATAIVAALLLAPWPTQGPGRADGAAPDPDVAIAEEVKPAVPVRVDTARPATHARPAPHPAATAPPRPRRVAIPSATPPARPPRAQPTRQPAQVTGPGVLVPVM